jgi:hypothetical protein
MKSVYFVYLVDLVIWSVRLIRLAHFNMADPLPALNDLSKLVRTFSPQGSSTAPHSGHKAIGSYPILRASNEHLLSVRVPREGNASNGPMPSLNTPACSYSLP